MGISSKLKKFDEHLLRARADIPYLYVDTSNLTHCKKCGEGLGIWRMLRRSIRVKKGEDYIVVCKSCGKANRITKGQLGRDLDERWQKSDDVR